MLLLRSVVLLKRLIRDAADQLSGRICILMPTVVAGINQLSIF
jgi:hypothetical protein